MPKAQERRREGAGSVQPGGILCVNARGRGVLGTLVVLSESHAARAAKKGARKGRHPGPCGPDRSPDLCAAPAQRSDRCWPAARSRWLSESTGARSELTRRAASESPAARQLPSESRRAASESPAARQLPSESPRRAAPRGRRRPSPRGSRAARGPRWRRCQRGPPCGCRHPSPPSVGAPSHTCPPRRLQARRQQWPPSQVRRRAGEWGATRVPGVAQRERPAGDPRHTEETEARRECLVWHSASGQPSSHGTPKWDGGVASAWCGTARAASRVARHTGGGGERRRAASAWRGTARAASRAPATHRGDGGAMRVLGVAQRERPAELPRLPEGTEAPRVLGGAQRGRPAGSHDTHSRRTRDASAWCGAARAARDTQGAEAQRGCLVWHGASGQPDHAERGERRTGGTHAQARPGARGTRNVH